MIGLFDSGSGGLSVLTALHSRIPQADVCYFGDIAHAPYGVRSQEELASLTVAGIGVLKDRGATEIVSACNSVSSAVLAGAAGDTPIVEMTKPTAIGMQKFRGKRVLLIATPATVASKIYERALANVVSLNSLAIAELAGAIEFGATDGVVADIVRDAFVRKNDTYDALLLGCTHYPLVSEIIEREAEAVFGTIECIDPAGFVADEVERTFDCNGSGVMRFAISKDSEQFRNRVAELFPSSGYTIEVI